MRVPTLLLLAVLASACSGATDATTTSTLAPNISTTSPTTPPATASTGRPARCEDRAQAIEVGRVTSPELDEISGAAASRSRPGVIWVHNDSGSDPVVFALDESGSVVDRVALPDLTARDWEDMAIGPGPNPAIDYLYLADIGDNQQVRQEVEIHRIAEPAAGTTEVTGGETLRLVYPAGPLEAETLLVDQVTGDLTIAGKALSGATPLFTVSANVDWSQAQRALPVGEIHLGTFATATGGDADGERVVIRTYDEVFLWERVPDQSITETLLAPPCRIATLREPQGEAIALTPGGFYTLSEGLDQPILLWGGES